MSDKLSTATHVFVRRDAVRKPLQPPYDGPYLVLKRTDKHFTVSRHDTVSVDRLKPAYLDSDPPRLGMSQTHFQTHHPPRLPESHALVGEYDGPSTSRPT